MTLPPAPVAWIVVIGDEILSGKVADTNSPWLLARLRRLGIRVRRVEVVADEVEVVAEAVARAARGADWVFTTGGVGPTHDDVTMQGVARAFGRSLVEHPELADAIRRHVGDPPGAALRMARVPEGARLLVVPSLRYPQVAVENVLVFPGVPSLLRLKFDAVAPLLGGRPVEAAAVFVRVAESVFAETLDAVVAAHPEVRLGSYPHFDAEHYRVMVTLEAEERPPLDVALADLVERLGDAFVHRVDARWDPGS